jgi:hypothetical protein
LPGFAVDLRVSGGERLGLVGVGQPQFEQIPTTVERRAEPGGGGRADPHPARLIRRIRASVDRQRGATHRHALSGDRDDVSWLEACRAGETVFEHHAFPVIQPVPGRNQRLVDCGRVGVADLYPEAERRAGDLAVDLCTSPRATDGRHPRRVAEAGQLGSDPFELVRRHVRRDLRRCVDVEAIRGS